ncbi:(3R)-hydroxyacyl-ACP dehydratase subunit HadA [Mycolicibacterium smegmatis]|uniref:(3R)-hydroxyacyl-ACP dehydratase subunit HadA n=1 Tax=Mycolicibacterium smegmatis TaxID=1772 RepID=UPI00071AF215|nr:(3R)-hydroxyacyl-ACP dehydratase subunit HadA [Mycolicibacterium smegmatis]MDF1902331.1 (3R)-hydroxyacyl-ACP dehydratase subunit HadA [Mycolicibacterium smegmatis]MDF1908639.1 (3R)-hydroxyacyl-ACP dehydratase subunit HadA [Mycolicibacterium smegmatis]MDF1918321.1 (3R)-hydroxyacyl-ACP dehydratase subunit HadA [Mycolicibacterium smegmatis]MDF1927192.1 (3R)-hydroxyacyl-ACP dehydratase subunit HadA [Mycolicibacterium smegmatis]UAK53569.1 (3R)-hydroxyacyl-ACP dehydratase subunit HadA [Mycoliciba
MALSSKIVGMHYRYPDFYEVGREKIREHALAIKNDETYFYDEDAAAELGHDALPAPLTFICIFGYQAQSAFFDHADIGVREAKIVQVDQELKFFKPIKAGDRLYCDVYVHAVRRAHGTDIIVTKNIITNDAGEIVQEAYTTLAGRAGDGEEGFSDGYA